MPPAGTWMRSAPAPSVWSRLPRMPVPGSPGPTSSAPAPSPRQAHVEKSRGLRWLREVQLAGDDEHAARPAGSDQRIRHVQREHRARAHRAHVERVRLSRADQFLHARRRGGLNAIGRRGGEDDDVDLVGREIRALEALARRLRAQIGRALVVGRVAARRDAGLLGDERQRRGGKLRERFVGHDAFWQVRTCRQNSRRHGRHQKI